MLKLQHIDVYYGRYQALKNVSMEIGQGELVTILGANGAGKSTLFNTISGLNKVSEGQILFNDTEIHNKPPHKLVRSGIVQCAEGRKLFPEMSVYENLKMGSYSHRKEKEMVKQRLDEIYALFPILFDKRKDAAGSLSGGQQQMLAIGRALMSHPKILLLDEPSLGLAPLIVDQMFKVIEEIHKKGTTILLAEQNAHAALSISSRGYVMESGQLVMEGSRDELFDNEEIKRAYIGA
ncbi:ABC transporter ATP-binding protein [Metabacillus idriensis]|uniref:ABC transporter ATP-binding protein n=1 Tax=Metabacillus idriensis TaxID=324768 RepID=UPI0008AA0BBB|nr:ABC transporter ATP-binding protein [Metabacillus idriensis]MCM3594477.1 ABC transporter ATP-binding protein [Metabacillus idriensis]OHR73051.1 ABC transporter ATP-binding protein [Bacillus sp. HMSC76G11]